MRNLHIVIFLFICNTTVLSLGADGHTDSRNLLCTTLSVDGSRYDSASISGTFSAREKIVEAHVLQCFAMAQDANWRRGACFRSDEYGFVGEESVAHCAEFFESFLQSLRNLWRQPEV